MNAAEQKKNAGSQVALTSLQTHGLTLMLAPNAANYSPLKMRQTLNENIKLLCAFAAVTTIFNAGIIIIIN